MIWKADFLAYKSNLRVAVFSHIDMVRKTKGSTGWDENLSKDQGLL